MNGDYTEIRIDRRENVTEVILNKPDKLNAMAPGFFFEIKRAFEEIDADDSVRVAIIRGEGRMFTAGLDLNEAAGALLGPQPSGSKKSPVTTNMSLYRSIKELQGCFSAIETCRKPVIAAVHGNCIGGGLDLITACDIRICSADASFSIYETKIAIVADVGTLQRITAIVGKGMAREMAYTSCFVDSQRALGCGLVNAVYQDQEALLAAARGMAAVIAANSPLSVQGTKMVLNYSDEHSTADGLEYVAQWNSSFLRSNDINEALAAFLEKRQPKYSGE